MNYVDVLNFPVNYVTKRDVLMLKNLRKDMPNVVLRHDYDKLKNWRHVLKAEQREGAVSSNYLLMNKYNIPVAKFREYERQHFEFGLHANPLESHDLKKEIATFEKLKLELTTMTPHGWKDSNGEYPPFDNWVVDKQFVGSPCSMNSFYGFCHKHFGDYDKTYDTARYFSRTRKTFFDIPYRGVMLIDDSGGWRKPFTEKNVLEHMENGKVYVFLFHPENLLWSLEFKTYLASWLSCMKWINPQNGGTTVDDA